MDLARHKIEQNYLTVYARLTAADLQAEQNSAVGRLNLGELNQGGRSLSQSDSYHRIEPIQCVEHIGPSIGS